MKREDIAIALINPPSLCVNDDRLEPPLGLLYIAAAARAAGWRRIAFHDLSGCKNEAEVRRRIETIPEASIYALPAFCTNHDYARRVVAQIRKNLPPAYVVMGGVNPTVMPRFTLENAGPDAVVTGEGEDAFIRCLESFEAGRPLTGIVTGAGREDIDSYPDPARDLPDWASYSRRLAGEPVLSLISSRGCNFRCVHCNSVIMGGGADHARYRGPANLAGEIESLRGRCRNFRFNDDNFTGNPRLISLLDRLAGLDIVFRVFARVEDLTPANCRALRRAGCTHVSVGLETLNPEGLKVLRKTRQIGKEGNIRNAKDAGLVVRAYFMVGLPTDAEDAIERDFAAAARLGLDEFTVYPLIPYPGTEIANEPGRFGYTIVNPDFRDYVQVGVEQRTCFALRHRNFGPDDVRRWKARAEEILLAAGARFSMMSEIAR